MCDPFARTALILRGGYSPCRESVAALEARARHSEGRRAGGSHRAGALAAAVLAEVADIGIGVCVALLGGLGRQGGDLVHDVLHLVGEGGRGRVGGRRRRQREPRDARPMPVRLTVTTHVLHLVEARAGANLALVAGREHAHGPAHLARAARALGR